MDRWWVYDRERLRGVLGEAVALAGGQRSATRASKVPQARFSRLLADQGTRWIPAKTVQRLRKWLSVEEFGKFESCCLKATERSIVRDWETSRLTRLGESRERSAQAIARERVYNELKAKDRPIRDMFDRLERRVGRPFVSRLASRAFGNFIPNPRGLEAFARIIDPLVDAEASEGIDPTWRELATARVRSGGKNRPTDLQRFLELGIQREEILLRQGARATRATPSLKDRLRRAAKVEAMIARMSQ